MIFKNKRFKYIILFVVVLCSLCAFFAVSASAIHYTADEMYGENDPGYTYVCDFNPYAEDENGNLVCDVASDWGYFRPNILKGFTNCTVQLICDNGTWCLSVAPIDYSDEVTLYFEFENCILERGRKYCSMSLGFGRVSDPDQRIDWYLDCFYSNLEAVENKNSTVGGCFPSVGQSFLDFKLGNDSYRCQVSSVGVTFYEVPLGNVIYIYSFGFGSGVENQHDYDNMLKPFGYGDFDLGIFVPIGSNVDNVTFEGFGRVVDFTTDSLNLTDLYLDVLALSKAYTDVGSNPHIYLFFPDSNIRDCLAIGTSRLKGYWDDFEYLDSPTVLGIKPDNTLTLPGHYQLDIDENGDYIYNSPVRSFGNFYTRFVDICIPLQYVEEMYDEDVTYTLYRYSSEHDYMYWLKNFTEKESYSDGYDFGYGTGLNVGKENGYLDGWDDGYETGHYNGFVEGQENGYDDGYEKGYDVGYDVGFDEGTEDGYNRGYSEGDLAGEQRGYKDGHLAGYNEGVYESASVWEEKVDEAFSEGYADGYNIGFANGDDYEGQDFNDLIITTAQAVGATITSMFNWELFGINLMALLGGFMFLSVALFIVKFVK